MHLMFEHRTSLQEHKVLVTAVFKQSSTDLTHFKAYVETSTKQI